MDVRASEPEGDSYTYRAGDDESVSEAVVRALATVSDVPVADGEDGLSPLYEAVDPDALDALFAGDTAPLSVQFSHVGYDLTIDEDQRIRVTER